ncbi:MAG TPA: hypothetical protein PL110_01250 [Candidatus Eremiobacteraeota bacterium]|nr:hypothetical protein [Candidatus Eremiobacteraeota bacterium]
MTQKQILEELKHLSNEERISILKSTLNMIREDLQRRKEIKEDRKKRLTEAAEVLLEDYNTDKELTIFTALDSEDFYG